MPSVLGFTLRLKIAQQPYVCIYIYISIYIYIIYIYIYIYIYFFIVWSSGPEALKYESLEP